MIVAIYMVMSIDGIVALDTSKDIRQYSSREDHDFFISSVHACDAAIMGSHSLNEELMLPKYVLTSRAEQMPCLADTTYLCGAPRSIYDHLRGLGYKKVALLGGPTVNNQFLKENLVDELFLTVEPIMLGNGLHLNPSESLELKWQLAEVRRLNERGTTVFHYVRNGMLNQSKPEQLLIGKEYGNISEDCTDAMNLNLNFWDERAELHANSEYYQAKKLMQETHLLRNHEAAELGDLHGKKVAHLQCHIGTDTISLAKLGADVVGLDYSAACVKTASRLAQACHSNCRFVQGNVYDSSALLGVGEYDIVYVSFGSITMLPNLKLWAQQVCSLLKRGGYLYLSELHPVAALLSDYEPKFEMDYFTAQAEKWTERGSYADGVIFHNTKETQNNELVTWNWTLGDIFTAILDAGLQVGFFHEQPGHIDFRYCYLEKKDDGKWYPPAGIPNVPATFTLKAIKE